MQELKKLEKLFKSGTSRIEVAAALGYRSQTVFWNWKKDKKIPNIAIKRVREYLNKKGKTK